CRRIGASADAPCHSCDTCDSVNDTDSAHIALASFADSQHRTVHRIVNSSQTSFLPSGEFQGHRMNLKDVRFVITCSALAFAIPALSAESGYRIFVTNESSGDLTVIDGSTNRVTATWPLGKRPRGLIAAADQKRLFVALS